MMGLQERYATMETKELVKVITLEQDQYTPEAIRAAMNEKPRGNQQYGCPYIE